MTIATRIATCLFIASVAPVTLPSSALADFGAPFPLMRAPSLTAPPSPGSGAALGVGPAIDSLAASADGSVWLTDAQPSDALGGRVRLSIRTSAGRLLTTRSFRPPGGAAVLSTAVAAVGSGATIAWTARRGGLLTVQMARCSVARCQRPVTVRAAQTGAGANSANSVVRLVTHDRGTLVVWTEPDGFAHWRADDRGHGARTGVLGSSVAELSLVSRPGGGAYAAWRSAGYSIRATPWDSNGKRGATATIGEGIQPHLAAGRGAVALSWRGRGSESRGVFAVYGEFGPGMVATAPTVAGLRGRGVQLTQRSTVSPAVASSADGRIVAAGWDFSGDRGGPASLIAARGNLGSATLSATPVDAQPKLYDSPPLAVAMDANGNGTVAWIRQGSLTVARTTGVSGFGVPMTIRAVGLATASIVSATGPVTVAVRRSANAYFGVIADR